MGQAADDFADWEARQQVGGSWDVKPTKASFTIDTGADYGPQYGKINYCEALLDAAQDSVAADASQEEIDAALARLIVMDLTAPKTAKTARMHFARYWPLIQALAPASYDHVIQEYAERLGEFR